MELGHLSFVNSPGDSRTTYLGRSRDIQWPCRTRSSTFASIVRSGIGHERREAAVNRRTRGLVAAIAAAVALIAPATAIARTPATGAKKTAIVSAILRHEEPRPSLSQARRCINAWTFRSFAYVQPHGPTRLCTQPGDHPVLDVVAIMHNTHGRWGVRLTTQNLVFTAQLRRLRIPVSVFKNLTHEPVLCSPGDHRGCKPVAN
jgi:hypothetical protein